MDHLAVKVENISKSFKIPEKKYDTLREYFFNLLRKKSHHNFKALENISFELKKGEWLGIIGKNGSGKSTFLKILAGIYQPDSGSVFVSGKMVPFLELGVGFNPNLTARENIFLNGTILGLSSQKIKRKFSEIVNFAEIGKFLDTPLKNFSSGMQVRLAFAIAIQAEADVYLLDEVLAVGDYIFQEKCQRVFEKLKQEKKTVIFVSHNMISVKKFCGRTIWIDKAKIRMDDDSKSVTEAYLCKQKNLDKKIRKTESSQSSLEIKKYLKEGGNPKLIISYKPIENLPADWLNISFIGRGININPQKPLPFIDGQFNSIICDFVLEWLDYRMGLSFLRECQRILKTGKNLSIYTVDLEFSIKTYLDKNPAVKLAEAISRHARVSGKDNITKGELFNDGFYLWGQKSKYDQSMLEYGLLSNNFRNIKYFDFSKIKYFGCRDFDEKWTKQAVLACTAKKIRDTHSYC